MIEEPEEYINIAKFEKCSLIADDDIKSHEIHY